MAAKNTPGVRGPQGPRKPTSSSATAPASSGTTARARFERLSRPVLVAVRLAPRWLLVVVLALLLFGGLALTLTWLAGTLLVIVGLFLLWLLLLAWPVLTPKSRLMRAVVVVGLFGVAIFKYTGRL